MSVRGHQVVCNGSVFLYGKFNGQVGEWLIPADCKSAASGYDGSNPSLSTKELWKRGRVVDYSSLENCRF